VDSLPFTMGTAIGCFRLKSVIERLTANCSFRLAAAAQVPRPNDGDRRNPTSTPQGADCPFCLRTGLP